MAEIFITRKVFKEVIDILEKDGHAVDINNTDTLLPPRELVQRARGKTGLISLLNDRIDSQVMDELSSLKVISNIAVGYDNIDIDAATRRNIMVTNTPGVLTETTADLAFDSLARYADTAGQFDEYGIYDDLSALSPAYDQYGLLPRGIEDYEAAAAAAATVPGVIRAAPMVTGQVMASANGRIRLRR